MTTRTISRRSSNQGCTGQLVPLVELGQRETGRVDQMIYHKNLRRVAYVFAETAGRPPADVVVGILADKTDVIPSWGGIEHVGNGWMSTEDPRPVADRTIFSNGSHIAWSVPSGFTAALAGEGEWKTTLDVFRAKGVRSTSSSQ
jgi:hypothetical protein